MPKFKGPRLPSSRRVRKSPQLDGKFSFGDLVEIQLAPLRPWFPVHVEAVTADELTGRPPKEDRDHGRLYTVRPAEGRGKVRGLHGARLLDVQTQIATLAAIARFERPLQAAPTPLRLVKCGPAELLPVPKDLPPVRSDAYREFVRGHVCLACDRKSRPVEAHHEGPHGLGVKTDDFWCVPLCAGPDGCHRFYTDHNHLPGLSRVASLALMHDGQRMLIAAFCRRLLLLLVPPSILGMPSEEEQRLFDLLNEEERSLVAEGGGHA
jgi:hypothetical protein